MKFPSPPPTLIGVKAGGSEGNFSNIPLRSKRKQKRPHKRIERTWSQFFVYYYYGLTLTANLIEDTLFPLLMILPGELIIFGWGPVTAGFPIHLTFV